jgi:diguanylate cyclase (GGDEF)-like protein
MQVLPQIGTRAETSQDRRQRARALATLFGAGALVSTVIVLSVGGRPVPGWEHLDVVAILVTIVLALGSCGLLLLAGHRIGPRLLAALTAAGTLLIGACQYYAGGGRGTAAYAMLYVWVVLHPAMYFGARVVAAHLALTVLVQGSVLVLLGESAGLVPQIALTSGTQLAAAIAIGALASQLRALADTDPLTGLGNRRVVDRVLAYEFALAARNPGRSTCVAMLDLDGFKLFNDEHGHQAGDDLLAALAVVWQDHARRIDTLARTGGDEFMLVLPACDLVEARTIVERLLASTPRGAGASAGIAAWDGVESAVALIRRADAALYRAKVDGTVVLAPPPGADHVAMAPRPADDA